MNLKVFNASIVAIALFTIVSAFALNVTWHNNTNRDLNTFITGNYVTLAKHEIESMDIRNWSANPDTSSPFKKISTVTWFGPSHYLAKIQFLKDDANSQIQVKVDSPETKSTNTFDIAGIAVEDLQIIIDANAISVTLVDSNLQEVLSFEQQEIR
jgi:hypothetical protein